MKITRMPASLRNCEREGQYRFSGFRWLLKEEVSVAEKRVVDLGAGPCHFARIAAEFGGDVTAVDGRDERIPDDIPRVAPNTTSEVQRSFSGIKQRFSLGRSKKVKLSNRNDLGDKNFGRITFIMSDVRDFDLGPFDVVLIFGLLYHFGVDEQIELLNRCGGKIVLIDTMVCVPDLVTHYPHYDWQSSVRTEGEFEGWTYPENNNLMASIGNQTSFWHTDSSYGRLFSKCGFSDIVAYRPLYSAKKYGLRSFYRLS